MPTLKPVDSLRFHLGTSANLVDSLCMTLIVFRHLPAVAAIEEQLRLNPRDLLADDEAEELQHLIDDASRELFGITANDTLYPALPEAVRARYGRAEWEAHFLPLGQYARDPNAHWRGFGLDCCCEQGRSLHCLDGFGRQLICAIDGLHPQAVLAFAESEIARAA
jgi:hypothetical protein